jgi:HK97 family phage prohead protease
MGEVMDALHRDSRRKITKARITKSPSDGSGRFVALVSTFGLPPDDQGDVIDRWAYARYIADAVARNRMPSVWWGHGYSDPQNAIGRITKMGTTDEGLVVEGQLSLDNARALNVYEGMLRGTINEFSIGYIVLAEHKESSPQYGTYSVLTEVSLSEISVVYAGRIGSRGCSTSRATRRAATRPRPSPGPRSHGGPTSKTGIVGSTRRPDRRDARCPPTKWTRSSARCARNVSGRSSPRPSRRHGSDGCS